MLARTLLAPLDELFARQVARHGDAVAVACGDDTLTYAELDRRSNRLAHRLHRAGIGPESQVALALERGVERIVAVLAIVKAGGAYVPLDAEYPAERLTYMLEVTGASLLLAHRRVAQQLPAMDLPALFPFEDGEGDDLPAAEPPAVGQHPDRLAYVNFTSGSTGRPKGVAVPQRAVARLVVPLGEPGESAVGGVEGAEGRFASLGPDDVVLQLAPLSFDAATLEVWGALANGARLEVFPPGKPSLSGLARFIRQRGVTTLWLTAGLFHQMVDSHPEAFAGVRQLLAGGDVLSAPHVLRALAAVAPGAGRVVNGYGPTENTTFTTCHVMRAGVSGDEPGTAVPIGRPIPGTRVVLLDASGRPGGDEGELAAGGDGLARGYLGRPADTAERFIPDPTPGRDGQRLYRTGDLARLRPDGGYDFLGRVDDQVKLRGFRVEPGEIESALADHPAVGQVAVLALPGAASEAGAAAGDKRLVAYVAADRAAAPVPELRRFLADRLPEWMVPAAFVHLAELPLNTNGKVDRRALARIQPSAARPEVATPYVAPRDERERRVAAVFAEMLGLDEVGVEDDLFELGGHSLALTRIVNRLREIFGVELPIAAMFEAPTVAAAAAHVEAMGADGDGAQAIADDVAPLRPEPRPADGPWEPPLAFPQRRIWFLQRLDPESLAYNFQARLDFRGDLDVAALHRALEDVVGRHEAFRTTFPARDGEPVQVIHPAPGPGSTWRVRLPRVDLAALPAERRSAECSRGMESIYTRPYDVGRLPLVYWALFRLATDDHRCLHAEHHLIHDGWSFNVFLEDFAAFYAARRAGRRADVEPLPVQFADFALWQHRWDGSADYQRQLDYWRRQLADPPADLELPLDRPRPARQRFQGGVLRRHLPAELTRRLRAWSRAHGASIFTTLLTAYFVLLHRYSGQAEFCLGTGIANRRFRELERLVGMVINTLVLRGDFTGDPSFGEAVKRVGATARAAFAHQDVPLDRVVEAVSPARDGSRNPLFQALFSFHDAPLASHDLPGLELDTTVGLSNGSAKFDLSVISILPREQGVGRGAAAADESEAIEMLWEYNGDIFDAETVEVMVAHYSHLLEAVLEDAERPLSTLPFLPAEDRRRLVEERNPAAQPELPAQSVAGLLRAAVAAHGERVALADGDGLEMTYAEFGRRAEALAHELRAAGIARGDRVGLFLDRSPEAVVAMAGVLLAGAAYLPLAPDYPRDRLAWLLADARPALVLTSRRRADLAEERLADGPPRRIVDLSSQTAEDAAGGAALPDLGADDVAYVLYTSGSTGRPKGVAVTHGGVVRLASEPAYATTADDVWLHLAPLSFDATTLEVWTALAAGSRLEVFTADTPSLAGLAEAVSGRGVTSLFLTAGLFHQMVDSHPRQLAGLGQLLSGGDVLSPPHVERALAAVAGGGDGDGGKVIDAYGPTENACVTTCQVVRPGDPVASPMPIGRPILGTQVYVLDRHGRLLPDNAVGEIWTGGAGLARGYLGMPARTALAFVPHPFAGRGGVPAGARAYRTGDLGRWRRDGCLDFVGRIDQQVKIRGFRIEPGEVESALAEHPALADVAALTLGEGADGKRLVAAVCAADGAEVPPPGELQDWLGRRLPAHLVPSAIVAVDAIPRTRHGKVDRRTLASWRPAPAAVPSTWHRATTWRRCWWGSGAS